MKKLENYCSIIFLFLLATTQVKAQSVDVVIRENGTERKESIDLPKSMTYPLDSLLNDWKAKNYIALHQDFCFGTGLQGTGTHDGLPAGQRMRHGLCRPS